MELEHNPAQPDQYQVDAEQGQQRRRDHSRSTLHSFLSLIHISEPTRLGMISYAVFCLYLNLHLSIRRQRQMCIRDSAQPDQYQVDAEQGQQRRRDHSRSTLHSFLSLIHISEPTRLGMISYAVFCL